MEESNSKKHTIVERIKDPSGKMIIRKLLKQDHLQRDKDRLNNEFEILKSIKSPYVVNEIAFDEIKGELDIEYFEGISLVEVMSQNLSFEARLHIAIQIVKGLIDIHKAKIVLRNLKPSHILVSKDLKSILYINLAGSIQINDLNQNSRADTIEGVPTYISPEQTGRITSLVDTRSDIYSLGVIFYQLFTRKLPFEEENIHELIHSHLAKTPKAPHEIDPHLSEALSALIMKCLEKDPSKRYQSAKGLEYDLIELSKGHLKKEELARLDQMDQFRLPSKIYGRNSEKNTIKQITLKAAKGEGSVLLLSGNSGMGKTHLINEFTGSELFANSLFVKGKYEKHRREVPYHGLIDAIGELTHNLLCQSESKLAHWRHQILDAVGEAGQVLINLVPDFKFVVGSQPVLPKMDPQETQNRINYVLGKLLDTFALKEKPLIVFLDDFQWCDEYTINFFEYYLDNLKDKPIVFIFGMRAQDNSPLLNQFLDWLKNEKIQIFELELNPLSIEAVVEIVQDVFSLQDPASLAQIIYNKTLGNPFFVGEFLKIIQQKDFATFDGTQKKWLIDLSKIESLNVTDNVAEFMALKLRELEPLTLELLKMGSVFGPTFYLGEIAELADLKQDDVISRLKNAFQNDLIFKASDKEGLIYYEFTHSRIQQAAYDLLTLDEKEAIHFQIAQILQRITPPNKYLNQVLKIAEHYSIGIGPLNDFKEKEKIGHLFFAAGLRAKETAAFSSALKYYRLALLLLPENSWDEDYSYTQSLYLETAITERIAGRTDESEFLFNKLIQHSKSNAERGQIISQKVFLTAQKEDFEKAQKYVYSGLKFLDFELPKDISVLRMKYETLKMRMKMYFYPPEKIKNIPEIKDKNIETILHLLSQGSELTYLSAKQLESAVMILKMMDLTLKHGMTEFGVTAIMLYSVMLTWIGIHDYKKGYKLAESALDISSRYNPVNAYIESHLVFWSLLCRWGMPFSKCTEMQKVYFKQQLERGNSPYAAAISMFTVMYLFASGDKLSTVLKEVDYQAHELKKIGSQDYLNIFEFARAFIGALKGDTSEFYPKNIPIDVVQEIRAGEIKKPYQFIYSVFKLWYLYLIGDYKQACEFGRQFEAIRFSFSNHIAWNLYYLYYSLAMTQLNIEFSDSDEIGEIKRNLKNFERWADASINYKAPYHLLNAEYHWIIKEYEKAQHLYDEAIQSAKENNQTPEEAIAHERKGKLLYKLKQFELAKLELREAMAVYGRWGAQIKVDQLKQFAPDLNLQHEGSAPLSFDISSLVEASRTLTKEIVLEKLVQELMKIVILNAGADRALLILDEENKFEIKAEISPENDQAVIYEHFPLKDREQNLAMGPINYAIRSQEPVVLKDAFHEGSFAFDSYIRLKKLASLAVVPLIHQGKLIGLIYLENSVTKGVFTNERLKLINVLSAQMAFSIQNARLYSHLESKVFERTEELNQKTSILQDTLKKLEVTQTKLLEQEMLKEREIVKNKLGRYVPNAQVLDQILNKGIEVAGQEKEITVLFCDIVNFTALSEHLSPKDTVEILNAFFSCMGDVVLKHGGIIDKFIGDAFMALFGAIGPDPEHAIKAVNAAINIKKSIKQFNEDQKRKGRPQVFAGIGINSGKVLLGNIGSKDRTEFTVIGDSVNIASRVEALTRDYKADILITGETRRLIGNDFNINDKGQVSVKGRTGQVQIYEVLD